MKFALIKKVFNRKVSPLRRKLNIELRKKLVGCYVWSIALYGSEIKTIGTDVFRELRNVMLEENGEDKRK